MTDAFSRFNDNLKEADRCLENYDSKGDEFALRYVWIACISAFEMYMTELVSEAGLRLIDRSPPNPTHGLRQIDVPLGSILDFNELNPSERLLFFKRHIFSAVQYRSFYRPDKLSEALSYIWHCQPKEKWAKIFAEMQKTGRYHGKTEQDIRTELSLIADRRDLVAHSMDVAPGAATANAVFREDAARVIEFISDLAKAIDEVTEIQR